MVSCGLLYFSDALESSNGKVANLRLVDAALKVHGNLVIAKSQVAPMKYKSVPRLELAATVLSSKTSFGQERVRI